MPTARPVEAPTQFPARESEPSLMQQVAHNVRSFADFTLDLTSGCLLRGTEEVKLRPKSFATLRYLVENQGRLVSKAELIQAVWPDSFVTDDSLVQCLMDVRRALGGAEQAFIKTVLRRGYIFHKEVHAGGAPASQTIYTEELEGTHIVLEEVETNGQEAAEINTRSNETLT